MNMEYKEVYFDKYCKTCEYWETEAIKDPCNECLGEPCNLHSHKPVKYKEDPKKKKKLEKEENDNA